MRYQDLIAKETTDAFNEFFKYAKAVPADKVEWEPAEGARTVLAQARECAKCFDWASELLADDEPFKFDESSMAASQAEMAEWKTVEECESQGRAKLERLTSVINQIPDEKLTHTKFLPFGGGRDFTWQEMCVYPRWNLNYHTGQVAYIQTMYGDKNMY